MSSIENGLKKIVFNDIILLGEILFYINKFNWLLERFNMSLGGFAEDEYAVDGDWESFNYGVAENYYDAMLGEEWDLLEDIGFTTIEGIALWLGYCDELFEENKEIIKNILNGTLMTCNGRTFIDAIVSEKKVELAECYIALGNSDIRLYILHMFYFKDEFNIIDDIYKGTILNKFCCECSSRKTVMWFLTNLFIELNKIYDKLTDNDEKIRFLNVVRNNIINIKYSEKFGKINLNDVCSNGFARILRKR